MLLGVHCKRLSRLHLLATTQTRRRIAVVQTDSSAPWGFDDKGEDQSGGQLVALKYAGWPAERATLFNALRGYNSPYPSLDHVNGIRKWGISVDGGTMPVCLLAESVFAGPSACVHAKWGKRKGKSLSGRCEEAERIFTDALDRCTLNGFG